MIEQTALEAIHEVQRLEAELVATLEHLDALEQQLECQLSQLRWLNDVRVDAQRQAEHWQEQYQAVRDELCRYTAEKMS